MSGEPRIQYVRSADGVNIAYWAMGDGPPLIILPNTPFSHIQLEWGIPECREWYQRLGAGRRVVRYDPRGFGLSGRDTDDFTLEANLSDIEAVAGRTGPGPFALYATGDIGMVAVTFAARHPDLVTHLALWCSWARRVDVSQTPQTRSLRALMDEDWQIYTETVARVLMGWKNEDLAQRMAAFFRECASPDILRLAVPAVYQWDVTSLLPQVAAPVLVLQRREMPSIPTSVAQTLASGFPDCCLVLLEGSSPLPWVGDSDAALSALREFFGDGAAGPEPMEALARGSSVTILFTDMEGSTSLTQRLGDEQAQAILSAHNAIIREALRAHSGREIKHTGDGIMASFASAGAALDCAITIQRRLADASAQPAGGEPVRVRIGINAGEPVTEGHDLFGTSVQLAARVCSQAEPGQVLVSNVVRELAAGKGFLFSDRGDYALRGFEDPVRLYELRWQA
jgi:class 3 adenylate cyclase